MFIRTTAVAAALALTSLPALAGSPDPAPADTHPTAPATPTHTAVRGDWTGGYGGVQYGGADLNTSGDLDDDAEGGLGGVHFGYDYDFGSYVLGGAIEYDAADIGLEDDETLDSITRLKLRGGYDLGPGLAYITAGAARASLDDLGTSNGGFYGIGYEHRITEQFSLGGEVLEHRFEDFDDGDTDVNATTAQVRATFRF